jgi:tartrate dehydratase beta subunit/fumarate hydratase class I family protein
LISGVVFTGRDAVHKYLHEGGKLPPGVKLRDGILYHCGPVMMKQDDGSWKCTAAGPTTSIREEPYQGKSSAISGFAAHFLVAVFHRGFARKAHAAFFVHAEAFHR